MGGVVTTDTCSVGNADVGRGGDGGGRPGEMGDLFSDPTLMAFLNKNILI
jgi:hypothetical protein